MDFQECIKFATENPVCYMATTDGDQPRVRALLMWFANQDGFYFGTFSPKQFAKQLKKNPKVEVCFFNNAADLADAKSMRVTGEIQWLSDETLVNKIIRDRSLHTYELEFYKKFSLPFGCIVFIFLDGLLWELPYLLWCR